MKRRFHAFAALPPGKRFVAEYTKRQADDKSTLHRVISVGAGIILFTGGLVALPGPGPGIIIVAFGAMLIGREWRPFAAFLDRTELWLRRLLKAFLKFWRHASIVTRSAVIAVAAMGAAATAWVGYRVFIR